MGINNKESCDCQKPVIMACSEDEWSIADCFETFELRPVGNGKTALFTASSECFWEKYTVVLTADELRELAKVASRIADKLEVGEK